LVLVGTTGFLWLRHAGDEGAIRSQLTRLAACLHTSQGANPIFQLPTIRDGFDATLDDNVHVHVADVSIPVPTGRRELAEAAVKATGYFSSFEARLRDFDIKLDEQRTMAQVAATVDVATGGDRGTHDTRAINFILYKRDGTWRVTSVTVWGADANPR
jgi:hypothetical protein